MSHSRRDKVGMRRDLDAPVDGVRRRSSDFHSGIVALAPCSFFAPASIGLSSASSRIGPPAQESPTAG